MSCLLPVLGGFAFALVGARLAGIDGLLLHPTLVDGSSCALVPIEAPRTVTIANSSEWGYSTSTALEVDAQDASTGALFTLSVMLVSRFVRQTRRCPPSLAIVVPAGTTIATAPVWPPTVGEVRFRTPLCSSHYGVVSSTECTAQMLWFDGPYWLVHKVPLIAVSSWAQTSLETSKRDMDVAFAFAIVGAVVIFAIGVAVAWRYVAKLISVVGDALKDRSTGIP